MRRSSFDISILLLLVLLLLCHAATIYAARLPSSTGLKKRLDTYGCPGNYSLVATEQPVYITDNADSSSPSHTYANNMECQWSISALDPSKIIQLTFSHFDLECGYDYLTIYDGESNNVLAKLCGNRTSMNDTVFSDSSSMKIVMQTDATTVRSGFLGTYQAIDRCNACQSIGHGTCNVDNSTCECDPGYFGTACEKPGQNDTMFTARYYHSAVYYPPRDSMIVYGGTTMNGMPTPELLEFHFSNMSWTEPMVASTIKPTPRYGHTLFVYNNSVYCFGGSNRIGIVMNDLWKLDPDGWNWTEIQYANSAPPILIDPSVTIATLKNDSTRIFLFGGYSIQTALPGAMSRDLYAYDLDANIWYEGYRQNSVGLINAAGIYHSERDSLFYFGGIRSDGSTNVYEYHLPSDLWFIGEQQPLFQGRVQGTYADVGNGSNYLFVGGEMPYQNYTGYQSNQCYFGDILLYDLACGTMNMQRNIPLSGSPEQHLVPRKGHSMVVRDDVAWILGGHNGFDLADMISFPLPKDNLNSSQAAQCKALRWCGNYNDCQDCLQRSHCSYCNNMCLYDTAKAGTSLSLDGTCQSLEAAQVSSSSCPSREILNLNDTFEGSVEFGSVLTFKTFVDAPKSDIVFSISPANNSIQLFFQTLNVWQGNINNQISPIIFDKDGNIQREIYSSTGIEYQSFNASQLYDDANPLTGTSPTVILRADDWRRFSGYYVYRVSADPELLDTSMFQSTINSTNAQAKNNSRVVFTLTVDTVAKDASSSDSASDGNPAGDSLKIAAVVLLAVSVVMFGAITLYMLRRMRRYANARETLAYDMQDFGSIPDLTVSNSAGVYRAKVKTLPLQPKQDDIQPENMAALTITDNLQPLSVHPYKSDESTVSEARINNSSTAALYAVHYVLVLPTPPPPPPPADRPSTPQESLRPSSNTSSASVTPSEEHTPSYLPAIALGCALIQVKPDTQNDTTSEPGPSCNNQGRS